LHKDADGDDGLSSKRVVLIGDLVLRRPSVTTTVRGDDDEEEAESEAKTNAEVTQKDEDDAEQEVYSVVPYLAPKAAVHVVPSI